MTAITSWRRHILLHDNAQKFTLRANVLQLLTYVLGLVTVVLVTLYGEARVDGDAQSTLTIYNRILIILPIVTGLIATTRSKLRSREKGASCEMAAAKVVAEIYKFRLRALEYDTTAAAAPAGEGEEGEVQLGPKQREQRNRERFVDRVQGIYSAVLMSEVAKGGALNHEGGMLRLDMATREEREEMKEQLLRHVQVNLYGRGRNWRRLLLKKARVDIGDKKARDEVLLSAAHAQRQRDEKRDRRQAPSSSSTEGASPTDVPVAPKASRGMGRSMTQKVLPFAVDVAQSVSNHAKAQEGKRRQHQENAAKMKVMLKAAMAETIDDFFSVLQSETYIDQRARPICSMLEELAPWKARQLQLLEFISLGAQAAGAVLAVIGFSEWVATVVALSIIFQSLMDYFFLNSQVVALNEALQQMHRLLSWWDSLSLIQRKSRSVKSFAADVVESAVLTITAARTGQSITQSADEQEEEQENAAGGGGDGGAKAPKSKSSGDASPTKRK